MYAPKTASEANRLAILAERAREIITDGYTFSTDTEIGVTYVCKPGELHSSYEISDGRCNCPAREKERTCKHELAAELLADETAKWEAICAQYDAEQALQ